jgi:hypothetical protein
MIPSPRLSVTRIEKKCNILTCGVKSVFLAFDRCNGTFFNNVADLGIRADHAGRRVAA